MTTNNAKIIIGLVGEIASGKTTLTNYLKSKYGAVTFRFSDMLRDIATRMHLEHSRHNLQTISTIMRQNFSEDIMSKVLTKDVEHSDAPMIITEGIRRPSDIVYLTELPGFVLVAVHADERTRFERLSARHENADDALTSWEDFQEQSKQEAEQKIAEIAATADYTIDNNAGFDELYAEIDRIIAEVRRNPHRFPGLPG